ncbi:MAG: hypothetical protein NXH74_12070 [Rhodobacteraceae bacterium]|nr:hypothetical protein [Paracoccaceae bacterium]
MPRHVLIHPGFHKTGTSTLQRNLLSQADRLSPRLRVMLNDDLIEATRLARKFSVHSQDSALDAFTTAIATALEGLDMQDDRPLLLSSEALVGQLPGRKQVAGYDAAAPLMARTVSALRDRIGQTARITVWFTTRAPEPWMKSAYYQNLRQRRLCEDFESHARRLERAARLDDFVAQTRAELGDRADVTATRIETCAPHRLGPLGVALDLLGVRSDDLAPVRAHNVQPEQAAAQLLDLNRSRLSDAELAKAKRKLVRAFRKGDDGAPAG